LQSVGWLNGVYGHPVMNTGLDHFQDGQLEAVSYSTFPHCSSLEGMGSAPLPTEGDQPLE